MDLHLPFGLVHNQEIWAVHKGDLTVQDGTRWVEGLRDSNPDGLDWPVWPGLHVLLPIYYRLHNGLARLGVRHGWVRSGMGRGDD